MHTCYRVCLGKPINEILELEFHACLVLDKIMHYIPGNIF